MKQYIYFEPGRRPWQPGVAEFNNHRKTFGKIFYDLSFNLFSKEQTHMSDKLWMHNIPLIGCKCLSEVLWLFAVTLHIL